MALFGDIEEHRGWTYVGWAGIVVTYIYLVVSITLKW